MYAYALSNRSPVVGSPYFLSVSRTSLRLGDAPGATNAWLVGDTDKTVRRLADEVLTAD
jgi:hypothetical protein